MNSKNVGPPTEAPTPDDGTGGKFGGRLQRFAGAERTAEIFHGPRAAWVVLFVGLILTVSAWYFSSRIVDENAEQRFAVRSEEIALAIEARMKVYEGLLWGGAAFFHAADDVNRDMWKDYVEQLELKKSWPGIQGFGFSVPVSPEDRAAHIRAIREEGFPDYTIRPEGVRDTYSAIIYLEPFDWRNQRAFGYDMWSNSMRREAMARARDHGVAATSGIITLVQETDEDVQRGFLTYVPLYQRGARLDSVDARRAAFRGWVYAPFRMGDFMRGILGEGEKSVAYEIFSGEGIDRDHLLFDSDDQFYGQDFVDRSRFTQTKRLDLQGQVWTINFTSGPGVMATGERMVPVAIGVGGIIIDLLLFYVITSLAFVNRRVRNLARDITKQLHSEKERVAEEKRRAEQLNSRLHNAIEALQDGFAMYGADDRLIIANSKYREYYEKLTDLIEPGVSFETLIREGVRRGQWPEANGCEESWIAERLARHGHGGEVFEQAVSGGRWLQIAEYKTADGDTVGIRVDISDLKNAQAEAEDARRAAEAASQAKSRFLSMMSHEIRTPLNGVLGVHRLLDSEDLRPDVKGKLRAARESGEFLLALVNQVLDFSRIEAGSIQRSEASFTVDLLLDALHSMFRPQIGEKRLDFECDITGDGAAPLRGDYDHIRQILFNLVGNAIKFTQDGTVRIAARLDKDGPDSYRLGFTVSDTGPGITAEDQEKIFEEFFQTSIGQEAGGGTGLGLAIADRLATAIGGRLTVESRVGHGSSFAFTVSVKRSETLVDSDLVDTAAGKIRPLHALVVEDNEINQMIACEILRKDGHSSEVAVDGVDAIEKLSEHADRFDLALMDIRMPRMDGVEATKAIRAMGLDSASLPIIALTANAFEEQKREYLEAGMQAVLTKPVEIAAIRKTLALIAANAGALDGANGEALSVGEPADNPEPAARDDRTTALVDREVLLSTRELIPTADWAKTWRKFKAECDRRIAELDSDQIDETESADVAHNLKGMAANLGFARLSEECAEIVAKSRNNIDTREIRSGLRDIFQRSLTEAEKLAPISAGAATRPRRAGADGS